MQMRPQWVTRTSEQRVGRGEGDAVVRADGGREAEGLKALSNTENANSDRVDERPSQARS
jgi:hypothetical protein